jgi:ammonium transporter, Amt family
MVLGYVCIYEPEFAAITYVVLFHRLPSCFATQFISFFIGSVAERSLSSPLLGFVFFLDSIAYDPVGNWTWNSNGWSSKSGGLDAGGLGVYGIALTLSLYLDYVSNFILGMWLGWFGFNYSIRAAQAFIVTNLCASVAPLIWKFRVPKHRFFVFKRKHPPSKSWDLRSFFVWDWRLEKKRLTVSFCSGAIAGLVAITLVSGFVGSRM